MGRRRRCESKVARSVSSKAGKTGSDCRRKIRSSSCSVDDDAVGRVTAGLQERTGLTLQRLIEPKD